jgi:hypothetical protein
MSLRWTESELQRVPEAFTLTVASLKDSCVACTRTNCPVPSEHSSLVIGGHPSDLDQQLA